MPTLMSTLAALKIDVRIHASPDEVANPIPFAEDRTHKSYDRESVERFHRLLVSVDKVLQNFRARIHRQMQPGAFLLGQLRPRRDAILRPARAAAVRSRIPEMMQEAYSHEVSSAGFWPGGGEIKGPAFYSYTTPEPAGFKTYSVLPKPASYHQGMGEFLLMYDDIRWRGLRRNRT